MALNQFISRVKENHIARQNKFRVNILGPLGPMTEPMTMFAETVSMPRQTLVSSPDELRYGPLREVATGMSYGPTNITFICTTGLPEKIFFEDWQVMCVSKSSWEARYYENYIGQMQIWSLDPVTEKDIYGVELREVFPKTISGQDFGSASNDSYQTIDVELAFRTWHTIHTGGTVEVILPGYN